MHSLRSRVALALVLALGAPVALPGSVAAATPGAPDVSSPQLSSSTIRPGETVTLSATIAATPCQPTINCASWTELSTGDPLYETLTIDAAYSYVYPFGPYLPLTVTGGAFGSSVVDVTVTIRASDLPLGTSHIYVVAYQSVDTVNRFGGVEGYGSTQLTYVDQPPTDIGLSSQVVDETAAIGTPVGTLSTTDPDPSDSFTYTLVSGPGSDDNAAFTIAGGTLTTNAVFNYATQSSYAIRVRTTDAGGLFFEKQLTITVRSPQVGTVTEVVGAVTIIHPDGSQTTAVVGSPVAMGDVIETSRTGAVSILFIDNSSFTISESARMLIDTFIYNAQDESGSSFFTFLQGVFIYVSGLIGKNNPEGVQIETGNGGGGIRGSEAIVRYDSGTGITEYDLILGTVTFTPLLSSVTSTFDAPMTIRFDASGVLSAEPLSQASYDLQKQAILSLFGTFDTTAPTADPSQSPAANGAGWNSADVTVTWNWADEAGGSGVDAANCTTSGTSSGEGTFTLTATCNDLAGNTGSASHTVKIDKTFPTLAPSVSPNPVALGGAAAAAINASDAGGSGLDPALTGCGPLDTSTVGTTTVSCTATDNAGNEATASATYVVGYGFGGFRAPLPTSALSRSGSTIPVKFTLSGLSGPLASALAASLATNHQVRVVLSGAGTSGPVRADALCTWNATDLDFQCNIKTPKGLTTGRTNPYFITAQETMTPNGSSSSFFAVPGAGNLEIVYFK